MNKYGTRMTHIEERGPRLDRQFVGWPGNPWTPEQIAEAIRQQARERVIGHYGDLEKVPARSCQASSRREVNSPSGCCFSGAHSGHCSANRPRPSSSTISFRGRGRRTRTIRPNCSISNIEPQNHEGRIRHARFVCIAARVLGACREPPDRKSG